MAKAEYVRLSLPETGFGQTHLLRSQLELLNLIQSFHRFRVLRDEELVLKVTLKNYIEETEKLILKLEKLLPKAHYHEERHEEETGEEKKKKSKKLTLEEEIAKVRAKLARIKSNL